MGRLWMLCFLSGWLFSIQGQFDTVRYASLITQFKCPVCQGQSIADSSAKVSVSMREQIKDMLTAGRTDQEINQYFIKRFGQKVKFSPDYVGLNHTLWLLPLLLFGTLSWRLYSQWRRAFLG